MFLILAMCMGLTIPVHATFGSSSSELDYAIGRVERFLGKENYEVVNDLSLSNPIPVYNFSQIMKKLEGYILLLMEPKI